MARGIPFYDFRALSITASSKLLTLDETNCRNPTHHFHFYQENKKTETDEAMM